MKIYGKVIAMDPKERVIKILCQDRIDFLHMTRRQFKDYGLYFSKSPYVFVNVGEQKKQFGEYYCYETEYFRKIIEGTHRQKKTYFNIDVIRRGLKKLINGTKNKLFLDLEFSLPSYYQTMVHIPEILQYGIVVEDENKKVIFQEGSLVKPLRKFAINNRTLKFLSKPYDEFENAPSYIEFYQLLERLIAMYDPKVIAWGKNDILTMEQSFRLNRLKPLAVRKRYVNLMQLIKNYYNSNTDLGLFSTYEEMSGNVQEPQQHDALEDAMMARDIYSLFENILDKEVKD